MSFDGPDAVELRIAALAESAAHATQSHGLLMCDETGIGTPARVTQLVDSLSNFTPSFASVFFLGPDNGVCNFRF